jgi:hypothetical protein
MIFRFVTRVMFLIAVDSDFTRIVLDITRATDLWFRTVALSFLVFAFIIH